MTATQQRTLTITPKTRRGQPAPVDGVPVWASSDETVLTVEPAADGLSCVIKAQAPGSARATVTADADLGEGVRPLIGIHEETVTPGEATIIEIVAGPAEEQP